MYGSKFYESDVMFNWIRYQKIANKFIVTLTSKVHEMGKQYNYYYYHIFIIISSVFLCSLRIYTSMPSMRVSPEIENPSKFFAMVLKFSFSEKATKI